MVLLLNLSTDLGVTIQAAGRLISVHALGVIVGAPVPTVFTRHWPRKTVLPALMAIFHHRQRGMRAGAFLRPADGRARAGGFRARQLLRRRRGRRRRAGGVRQASLGHRDHVHGPDRGQRAGRAGGHVAGTGPWLARDVLGGKLANRRLEATALGSPSCSPARASHCTATRWPTSSSACWASRRSQRSRGCGCGCGARPTAPARRWHRISTSPPSTSATRWAPGAAAR
jgi:hypothetical protein